MSSAAWRTLLLTACALVVLLAIADILCAVGMGGASPWRGRVGANWDQYPFGVHVLTVQPGGPAAQAGLRVGDVIDLRHSSLQDRYFMDQAGYIDGRPIILWVDRGAVHKRIVVTPVAVTEAANGSLSRLLLTFSVYAPVVLTLWLILFASVIAWRRSESPEMRLLASALILLGANNAISGYWTTPWLWSGVARDIASDFLDKLALALWIALASTFGRPLSTGRRIVAWLGYGALVVCVAQSLCRSVGLATLWYDWNLPVIPAQSLTGTTWAFYIPLLAASVATILAVRATRHDDRKRAAWILASLALLWLAPQLGLLISFTKLSYFSVTLVGNLPLAIQVLAPAALTYAALSRRIIDIGFVLNRSLAFAMVSAIVVLTFFAVEWAAGTWFAGMTHTTSAIVGLVVALGLGLSLRFIHGNVDRLVDRVFFRKRHEDVEALRRFAHEAAYITDRATLLDRTALEVRDRTDAQYVSILLLNDMRRSYVSVAANGERADVGENDPGIVALRSWHKPVEIHTLTNSALRGEYAFPMVARGTLVGVLISGPKRDSEAYASDEYEALRLLAQGVGAALYALEREAADPLVALREAIVSAIAASHEALLSELRSSRNG
jgi:hypothetical protein